MSQRLTCPECNLIFDAPPPGVGPVTCPVCDAVVPTETPPPRPASASPSPAPAAVNPPPATSGRQVLTGVAVIAAVAFLAGGLVYAYQLVNGLGQTPSRISEDRGSRIEDRGSTQRDPRSSILDPRPEPQPAGRSGEPSRTYAPPPIRLERPVAAAPKPPQPPKAAVDSMLPLPQRVNRAIDRGLAYLRQYHKQHDQYRPYLGLLGLTLLECGVPADDKTVQQIAAWMRLREKDLLNTYELSLAILFFDRLGDPHDDALIRTFGQRLLDGQYESGGWTYVCISRKPPPTGGVRPSLLRTNSTLMPQIISWRNAQPLAKPGARPPLIYQGDNSNTQFAVLGLWVAQRYGVSAHQALLRTSQYFRDTQLDDGSWSYHPRLPTYRDSMTCAALLSLATRYGVSHGRGRDIRPDQAIQVSDAGIDRGLRFLDRSLPKIALDGRRITGVEARDPLYFLWSLERMAVIFDLQTIGGKEWYPWAADLLVRTQNPDGAWSAPYTPPVGTCFALLVLRRSNFARDLQLAVGGSKPRRVTGTPARDPSPQVPTIIQGPGAVLGSTTVQKPIVPPVPLGPTVAQDPKAAKTNDE